MKQLWGWVAVGIVVGASVWVHAKDRGGISWTVTEASGAAVVKASVRVTNVARGETVQLETTTSGQYTASNLIPGTYEVRVEAQGFGASLTKGVDVRVAEVTRADVLLRVG